MKREKLPLKDDTGFTNFVFISLQKDNLTDAQKASLEQCVQDWWHTKPPAKKRNKSILSFHPWVQVFP